MLLRASGRARRRRTSRPCRTGARGTSRACPFRPRPTRGGSSSSSPRSCAEASRAPRPGGSSASADLGGPREEQLVALDLVDVHLLGREEAGAVHRLLADEDRRQDGDEALRHEPVEREAVERELDQRRLADAVGEARAGDPRGALEVDPAVRRREVEVVARLEAEGGLVADALDLIGVLVGRPVGRRGVRRVRHALEQLVAGPRAASACSASTCCSCAFSSVSRSSSSGEGLPFVFVCARSSLACVSSSRQRSSAARSSSKASAAPLRARAPAVALWIGPRGSEVDQPCVR